MERAITEKMILDINCAVARMKQISDPATSTTLRDLLIYRLRYDVERLESCQEILEGML